MSIALKEAAPYTPPDSARQQPLRQFSSGGTFLTALAVFVLVNLLLWKFYGADKSASKDLWSGTGSIDLVLQDFNHLQSRPAVVLMGSSLMMFPFWTADKERYPENTTDIFHYHRSRVLETQLEQNGFAHPAVFNMAIFGQMASDSFLCADEFLKSNRRPDYLVLGIAPRDFSDFDVPSPMATMSFRRLVTLENFPHYASLYLPTWQSKLEFVAEHTCFFYGKRWHLQREFNKAAVKANNIVVQLYSAAGGIGSTSGEGGTTGGAAFAAASSSNNVNRGFSFNGSAQERWNNSLDEYRRRYRNIESRNISVQLGFFKSTLDLCRKRGIKAVVVNMPLTDVNRALLPPGWYCTFSHKLNEICCSEGAHYLDLGSSPAFTRSDYWDTTHLAHSGGYKLIDALQPILVK